MATTPEQRARRRAQRANAARLKENERRKAAGEKRIPLLNNVLTAGARRTQYKYADDILDGKIPEPGLGDVGSKTLGSLAAKALLGRAPERFLAFQNHFYHTNPPATEVEVTEEWDVGNEEIVEDEDVYPE